jgi:hypothetical protein
LESDNLIVVEGMRLEEHLEFVGRKEANDDWEEV